MHVDVIVIGGGPAGSTAAREAAAAGARVVLLDKAAFPRDKPCGGGVNLRAARLLPFDLSPVVERTISAVRFSYRQTRPFTRRYPGVLTYMTRRGRLDEFLVHQAVTAGADLRERQPVRAIDLNGRVTVRTPSGAISADTLIGADGANGVTARLAGLTGPRDLAVALEANVYPDDGPPAAWRDTLALDLGGIPGGYGWLFPKEDHLNVGVGGWKYLAGGLRPRLDHLARHFGVAPDRLRDLRGHHLPVRRRGAAIAGGRVMLVGDAAGLVDPLSGEGIYAAIASGRMAARHALAVIDGRARDLAGYQREVDRVLGPELLDSARLQDLFNLDAAGVRCAMLRRSDRLWHWLCRIIRGEETYSTLKRRAGPFGPFIDGASWATHHSACSAAAPDCRPGSRRDRHSRPSSGRGHACRLVPRPPRALRRRAGAAHHPLESIANLRAAGGVRRGGCLRARAAGRAAAPHCRRRLGRVSGSAGRLVLLPRRAAPLALGERRTRAGGACTP
ncbi:MAG: geranylgeranyl reductase family protein [Dehalococcoidia bacterium]